MFELIKHFLGLCPDHAAHMNLMDMLLGGGLLAVAGGYFHRFKGIFTRKSDHSHKHENCNHADHEHKH
ncbi:MAG TPA: hypothetical protein VIM11_04915 [Tepidisphaeraceae bacterium]|jgi:hypothetical protein